MSIKLTACGFCGVGIRQNGDELSDNATVTFKEFKDVELGACHQCGNAYHHEQEIQRMQVIHEMDMDEQDMSLEGPWI